MKKSKFIFPLIIFIVILIFLWRGLELNPHHIASPLIGKSVPQFTSASLFDSRKTMNEKIFLDHVSILNVFATWCISCGVEHPMLIKLHHLDPSVQIIGLAFKDKKKAVLAYLKKSGNPYADVINDKTGLVAIDLGVYGTPETFVIDKRGVIRSKITGPISPEILKDELLPLLKKLQAAW